MPTEIATQVITAASALAGVTLTFVSSAYLERRRAREARQQEASRVAAERAKWLREQRQKAYTALATAGEQALQFVKAELPGVARSGDRDQLVAARGRWNEHITELRKAYNEVQIVGNADVLRAAVPMWRTARDGGNEVLDALEGHPPVSGHDELIRSVAARMGKAGNDFLDAGRRDVQA